MSGHRFSMLDNNSQGWVSQCNCCGELQLSLGSVLIHMPAEQFPRFAKSFVEVGKCIPASTPPANHPGLIDRPVLIRTPIQNMHLAFSKEEYGELCDLLSAAALLLNARNLLENSKKK